MNGEPSGQGYSIFHETTADMTFPELVQGHRCQSGRVNMCLTIKAYSYRVAYAAAWFD